MWHPAAIGGGTLQYPGAGAAAELRAYAQPPPWQATLPRAREQQHSAQRVQERTLRAFASRPPGRPRAATATTSTLQQRPRGTGAPAGHLLQPSRGRSATLQAPGAAGAGSRGGISRANRKPSVYDGFGGPGGEGDGDGEPDHGFGDGRRHSDEAASTGPDAAGGKGISRSTRKPSVYAGFDDSSVSA